jgi:hypothetical protein
MCSLYPAVFGSVMAQRYWEGSRFCCCVVPLYCSVVWWLCWHSCTHLNIGRMKQNFTKYLGPLYCAIQCAAWWAARNYLEMTAVCLTRLNFVVLFHRSCGYKCKIQDEVLSFTNEYIVHVCINSKDIEHTYHITTRLSDGDAGENSTFMWPCIVTKSL